MKMDVLFETLKQKPNAQNHWRDFSGWEMEETIECVVLNKTI